MAKLASKHGTSNICLPTSKNVFDLNHKHFCLPTCKMCLPNMKCLTKLVVAKRASKDRKLWFSHVRQTMLVSFARPLDRLNQTTGQTIWEIIDYINAYNLTTPTRAVLPLLPGSIRPILHQSQNSPFVSFSMTHISTETSVLALLTLVYSFLSVLNIFHTY